MRIDQWLWVTRFFKSRSQATAACRAGRVRLNGSLAKASAQVSVGDKITWRDAVRNREAEVVLLIPRRVNPTEAAKAYVDFSDPLPTKEEKGSLPIRDRGSGRPEKKQRRDLDQLRGFQK